MRKLLLHIVLSIGLLSCSTGWRKTDIPEEVKVIYRMDRELPEFTTGLNELLNSKNDELRAWALYIAARDQVMVRPSLAALDQLFEAETIFRGTKNATGLHRTLLIKGHLYWLLGAREEVVPIAKECMKLREGDLMSWATAAGNFSTYLSDLKQYEEAKYYSDTVLSIFRTQMQVINPSEAYAVRAEILYNLGGHEAEADTLMAGALKLIEDDAVIQVDQMNIYRRALRVGALSQERVADAIRFAQEYELYELESEARQSLDDPAFLGETEVEALEALYEATAKTLELNQTLQAGFMAHEVSRNAEVMERLMWVNMMRRNWLVAIALLGVISLISVVMVYRNRLAVNRATMDRREAELALANFKNKLRPHFLFNQLNNVYGFLAQEKWEQAQEYVSDLGEYLREMMGTLDKNRVSIESELEALSRYAALQRRATYGHVKFSVHCDSTLRKNKVPSGILQPLVENSFKYAGNARAEDAFVQVNVERAGAAMIVEVVDSGFGQSTRQGGTGQGISMIKERLATYQSKQPEHWNFHLDFGTEKSTVRITMPLSH